VIDHERDDSRERHETLPMSQADDAAKPAGAPSTSHDAEQWWHAESTAVSPLEAADAANERDEAGERGEDLQNTLDRIELSAGSRPLGSLLLGVALGAGVVAAGLLAFLAVFVLLVGVIR